MVKLPKAPLINVTGEAPVDIGNTGCDTGQSCCNSLCLSVSFCLFTVLCRVLLFLVDSCSLF